MHDIEYRFEDKMPTPPASKYDKWRKMTFGKGGSTFVSDSRVKLPFMKPNVYGVINYFRTEVIILLRGLMLLAAFRRRKIVTVVVVASPCSCSRTIGGGIRDAVSWTVYRDTCSRCLCVVGC